MNHLFEYRRRIAKSKWHPIYEIADRSLPRVHDREFGEQVDFAWDGRNPLRDEVWWR